MKNKKLTYLLIPFVILIWGFVIFQIFNSNETKQFNNNIIIEETQLINEKITFTTLDLDYSDPFVSRNILPNITNQQPTSPVKKLLNSPSKAPSPIKDKPKTIIWPKLEYGGTINDEKGLLKINNRLLICEPGDTNLKIIINNLTADSVFLQYQGEQKAIGKNSF